MKCDKIIDHIVSWISNYSEKSNTKGFVIGVSGGIDSALVSVILAKTGKKVLCVSLPIHQNKKHLERVYELREMLKRNNNVSFLETDLSEITDVFIEKNKVDSPIVSNDLINLSEANARARLRMATLYYYAGIYNYLVVGTGNKVEDFGIGFFTKYGDGGVDISPIADLMKSEVYILAEKLKIPKSILECKPTDGLFYEDKSDEEQIGASYDELEKAMNFKKGDILNEREKQVLKIFRKRNRINKHKVSPIPVCKIPLEYKN